MKQTKRLIALLLTVVLALSLVACGGKKDDSSKPSDIDPAKPGSSVQPGGEAVISKDTVFNTLYASEVTTLNYLITTQNNEMSIIANVVDCLVEYDSYGAVEPALALSWEPNADATVWTFKLREGVKWVDKDGSEMGEVTADDFVTSARYVCDAANSAAGVKQLTGIIAGAKEYNDWTAYQIALPLAKDGKDEDGKPAKIVVNSDGEEEVLEVAPEARAEDIGVKAIDKYTVQYTLTKPCAYFVSMVSTGVFMPTSARLLADAGDKFGTSNEYLWYCGAYILSTYAPQNMRVLTKNASYWEADQVFIETVEQKYNAEASSVSTAMYLDGTVDDASISSELLSAMMEDPQYAEDIHPSRNDTSYSYWYLFNFDAQFDAEYEPENWTKAVNNENFRKSVTFALNRIPALYAHDTLDPTGNMSNTITPAGFSSASRDFTQYGDLPKYTAEYYYNTDTALKHKEAAMTELKAAGATFPVKVLLTYNPTSSNWANECQLVEQGLEEVLGKDYIDVIVQAGPDTGFLGAVRRSGKYALMKCNWGADYADPETWTDPFVTGSSYSFIYKSEDPATRALFAEYEKLVEEAKAITTDMEARFAAFAKAEALLLEHAFALPIHTSNRSYSMSKLNVFEGQYAPFGVASLRYKGQHLYEDSMSLAEFQAAFAEWQSKLG